jgi:hypothetical protein
VALAAALRRWLRLWLSRPWVAAASSTNTGGGGIAALNASATICTHGTTEQATVQKRAQGMPVFSLLYRIGHASYHLIMFAM